MKFSKKQIKLLLDLLKDPKKILIMGFLIAFAYVLNYDVNSYVQAKVVEVIDGDTIRVVVNNKDQKVRLFGIDAPEKNKLMDKYQRNF